jgi:hypothetical protein
MTRETLYNLAPPLIALQFLAFGWRVNREIHAADARQGVIPLPDVINIMSLFATVGCAIVLPIVTESYFWLSRMVVGGAYILIAFHPLVIAAHFRLWTREGTRKQARDGAGPHYVNREELATSLLSVLIATMVAAYLGMHVAG